MKHWKEGYSSTVQPDVRPPQLPDCDADTNLVKTLTSEDSESQSTEKNEFTFEPRNQNCFKGFLCMLLL